MNEIERAIESTKNRIHYITVNSENGTPSHCVKTEKQIEIQSIILETLEKTSDKNCTRCINKGKCAIHDNFNIDYCSDWSVEEIQAEQKESKTNGDLNREMNNEDLANWIFEKIESTEWDEDGNNNYEDDIAEWLDEVVSERN